MSALKDLTGLPFGRLTVVTRASNTKSGRARWVCDCSCGTTGVIVHTSALQNGHTQSCGCLRKENAGRHLYKHGRSKLREHAIWMAMRQRCLDPHFPKYANYGGRGIYICDAWLASFEAFYTDMGPRPSASHSLERINNDLGYSKENCIWATRHTQDRNTRRNHWVTYDGTTQCVSDWAQELQIPKNVLYIRLKKGMSAKDALTMPYERGRTRKTS